MHFEEIEPLQEFVHELEFELSKEDFDEALKTISFIIGWSTELKQKIQIVKDDLASRSENNA